MTETDDLLDVLREGIQLACQPQNASLIVRGRKQVLSLPRGWVLDHIERIATESLDLSDYWEYRRLLELAELLSPKLVEQFVLIGLPSNDPDIQEAAEDHAPKA